MASFGPKVNLLVFAQAAVIIGNGFFIPWRDGSFFGRTYLTLSVCVVTQLELQLVDPAKYFGMELLHQGRIAGEPSRIEALHRARQILDFLERRWIVLRQMVKLVQLVQPLPVGSLRICRHR